MTDMANVAKQTFQVLLRFNYEVKMYDADGMDCDEPSEARRMFAVKPRSLMVSLNDLDDDSNITLMYGKKTHANDIEGLMQALRTVATKYNMTFDPKQYGKEIDPKDFRNLMAVSESWKDKHMSLCEGMYGTSRSSYWTLDNARMIIHHDRRLRDQRDRTRHIANIFVETANGDRFQMPVNHLAAARALTAHVNAGGSLNDPTAVRILERAMPRQKPSNALSLAENNAVVKDFMQWTERFAPNRALSETYGSSGEDDEPMPDDQIMDEAPPLGDDSNVLTREDILLPNPNQSQSLSRETEPAMVHDDPTHPDEEHSVGQSYISRLKTLSGLHSGGGHY